MDLMPVKLLHSIFHLSQATFKKNIVFSLGRVLLTIVIINQNHYGEINKLLNKNFTK